LHLFDQNDSKNSNCEILLHFNITVLYFNVLNVIYSCDGDFSAYLLQSSVSHDPSEIILIG